MRYIFQYVTGLLLMLTCSNSQIAYAKFEQQRPVVLYIKAECIYCKRALNLLSEHNIDFRQYDVTVDKAKHRLLSTLTQVDTVPYIFIGDRYIGGYTDLAKILASGELHKLLSEQ